MARATAEKTPLAWHAVLLGLGLLVSCGGSASHHGEAQPSSSASGAGAGGTANGQPTTAGNTTGGNSDTGGSLSPSGGTTVPSTGGSSEGGSLEESGGEAGAATGVPALPLPPGCRPRSPEETSQLCSLAIDCDSAVSARTYCHVLDSGEWECQCANQDVTYRVKNAAGLSACAVAAGLCTIATPKLGADVCEQSTPLSDSDSCSVDLTCSAPVELSVQTDARAWRVRSGSTRCSRQQSDDAFDCACDVDNQSKNYYVLAKSGGLACEPLAAFCMKEQAPTYSGPEVCASAHSSSDSGTCFGSAVCGPQLKLTNQVSLAALAARGSSCSTAPQGGADCFCGDQSSAFQFHLSTPVSAATCDASLLNCNPDAVIKATGPAHCSPPPSEDDGDWCQATLTCNQDATVDNRSVVALGYLGITCRRDAAGEPWRCACGSGPNTAQLQLGAAGASGPEACSQASTKCLQDPGLFIGTYTEPLPVPPDPL